MGVKQEKRGEESSIPTLSSKGGVKTIISVKSGLAFKGGKLVCKVWACYTSCTGKKEDMIS